MPRRVSGSLGTVFVAYLSFVVVDVLQPYQLSYPRRGIWKLANGPIIGPTSYVSGEGPIARLGRSTRATRQHRGSWGDCGNPHDASRSFNGPVCSIDALSFRRIGRTNRFASISQRCIFPVCIVSYFKLDVTTLKT